MRPFAVCSGFITLILFTVTASALADESKSSVRISNPQRQVWKLGVQVTGGDGPAFGIIAGVAVPDDWPEQQVKILDQQKTADVSTVRFRNLGGARQMMIEIPRLAPEATAQAIVTFEVTRSFVDGPRETDLLQVATRPDRGMREYLAPSPLIESTHASIRTLAREITADKPGAWQQVEAIYDWVRQNVTLKEGSLKGALAALRDGNGDCEEYASLIIALCRASKIPARTVWVPGHCYCEFFLQDMQGNGMWIPCDATRDYPFGSVHESRMILQKGDNILVPELRKRLRYAVAPLKVTDVRGRTKPTISLVQQQVE